MNEVLSFRSVRHIWRLWYSNYFNKETVSKTNSAMLVFEFDEENIFKNVQ
jgi:hypothetical protein